MKTIQRTLLALLAVVPVALVAANGRQSGPIPTFVPDHANGIYRVGEKVVWTFEAPDGLSESSKFNYVIKKNNQVQIQDGQIDTAAGKVTIEVTVTEPAMLTLTVSRPDQNRNARKMFGVAVAPTDLKPVLPKPKDFDAFWKAKIDGLHKIPENAVETPGTSYKPEVQFSTVKMDHVNGTHVYGQFAKPAKPGKYPAILKLQWASPPYPLDPSWVIEDAAKGFIVLDIEPHDVPVHESPAYYQGLPQALKNYNLINWDDRDKSYFVEMYLRDYRGVDYLTKRPDWDGKTLIVMGTSMGGQQSLCVAGLHPKITHLIVNEPAGCDLSAGLYGRQSGYPSFPTNNPKVMEAAPYVDAINFAFKIKATSLVGMGFVDDVAPPAGIWTAFNLIRGQKEAAPMVDSPHNNMATPAQQMPINSRTNDWLTALAKGDRIITRR